MNQILLSFLCGAAFIGGATAMTILVVLAKSTTSKKERDELFGYWKSSLAKHDRQLELMARMCVAMEAEKDKGD